MESGVQSGPVVRAGDLDGLRRIYSDAGGLVTESDEEIVRVAAGWDVNVRSPWRRVLPKSIFEGFSGKASSKLFITNRRIVLAFSKGSAARRRANFSLPIGELSWCAISILGGN